MTSDFNWIFFQNYKGTKKATIFCGQLCSKEMASRGEWETNKLRANIELQLTRLITQLKDLEEFKDELVCIFLYCVISYRKESMKK